MSNRLTRRRTALIGGGCIFVAALLLLSQGAQAAAMAYQVSASGDKLFIAGDVSWIAGTQDLNSVPPISCGGEVLQGGYSVRAMSTGPGSYDSSVLLDATDLMLFSQDTRMDLSGVYRDGLFVDGCGASYSESDCGPMPEGQEDELAAATAYCSGAQFATSAIGSNLNVRSQGATRQAGLDTPDSLAAQAMITGNGRGTISFQSINMAGIGNTSALGYQNSVRQSIRADGNPFSVGAGFQWSSFAGLWQDEDPEGEE
jgi:hypothetical protein